jgi:hypothetical protein
VVDDEEEHWVKRELIVERAAKSRLPAIYPYKVFVQAGGLASYGIDIPDLGRRVANMADQILKGAKPSDIPVFQPTELGDQSQGGEGAWSHRASHAPAEHAVGAGGNQAANGCLRIKPCLNDRSDPITQLILKKIFEIGQTGIEDPVEISKLTIEQLGIS